VLFILSFPVGSSTLRLLAVVVIACGVLLAIPIYLTEWGAGISTWGLASSESAVLFVLWLFLPFLHHSISSGVVLIGAPFVLALLLNRILKR
jgi:hypothetical protein